MMNKVSKKSQNKISTDEESDDQIDCSCEILNDTSLSNVSDSSCDCSECLEAHLNAFNEIKQDEDQQRLREARSLGKMPNKVKNAQGQSRDQKGMRSTTRFGRASNLSVNKKTQKKPYQIDGQQANITDDSNLRSKNYFTQQNLNDYIMITKQRTRQYLNQRNKINKQDKKQKYELKRKIKQNLEILKYTVKAIQEKQQKNDGQNNNQQEESKENIHNFKWNHTPAISRELKNRRKNKAECRKKLQQRRNQRQKVNTNLEKIIPQFSHNPSQFLQQAKAKRIQKFKECKGCPYDHCPGHHMRTSQEKLQQIQKFILDKVKKYNQKKKRQIQKQQENDKVKKAKLRAIDLKCKQILQRSKKYDPSQSRTSFRLSIDNFSTFSQLKVNKQQKDEQKQKIKEMKKMLKQKGGRLEEAIYEDAFQNELPPETKVKPNPKLQLEIAMKKDYCQKITKEAKIRSPRNIKPDDQKFKNQKQQKRKIPMNPNEQKRKAKELALEIERKKMELMDQYKRQKKLKQSKNEKLKNQHKQSLIDSRR